MLVISKNYWRYWGQSSFKQNKKYTGRIFILILILFSSKQKQIIFFYIYNSLKICLLANNDFYIEIVVSPIVRTDIIGEIRVIWESQQFALGDRIVLYRSGDVVFQYEPQECSGSIDTGSFVGETNFTQSYTTYCTIFSGAYVQDNQTSKLRSYYYYWSKLPLFDMLVIYTILIIIV